jgi:hypothetical protein
MMCKQDASGVHVQVWKDKLCSIPCAHQCYATVVVFTAAFYLHSLDTCSIILQVLDFATGCTCLTPLLAKQLLCSDFAVYARTELLCVCALRVNPQSCAQVLD